jgi:uncharacterized damage-inducible protein DinB
MTTSEDLARHFLELAQSDLAALKRYAERAFAQLEDGEFHKSVGVNTNSVYVIMKHLAGNFRSRWTDFLTTDGEKATRDRDSEFVNDASTRDKMMRMWEEGWTVLLGAVGDLRPADLMRTVTIRGGEHTVMQAVMRAMVHIGQHVGQIMVIARHVKGPEWQWLSIPPGESKRFFRASPGTRMGLTAAADAEREGTPGSAQ